MLAIRRSWLHGLSLLTCLFALAFGAGSASAATADPNHVGFTLQG